ncbi:hypothetical protein C8258_29890 [Nocardia sp. MDA0666]|uniref:hypothetical protein n=1 Tax=Nocardia sp. MDA0666 TaxID=2135448 RepID=UPI000D116D99|nr:hypothetical protein [Nocardia sp. MDA0666]PSR59371.1 hypothetical protein C8258_29890 [Nocardia sp. MDA0666]
MARLLDGATGVRQLTDTGHPGLYLFAIERRRDTPALVVWQRRDVADQDPPPIEFSWVWPYSGAHAFDAESVRAPVAVAEGLLRVSVGSTPLFIDSAVDR